MKQLLIILLLVAAFGGGYYARGVDGAPDVFGLARQAYVRAHDAVAGLWKSAEDTAKSVPKIAPAAPSDEKR